MVSKRISVCLLSLNLEVGGAERVGLNILKHLDRKRFEVDLIVIGNDEGVLRKDVPTDIDVTFLAKKNARKALISIRRTLTSKRPDILFVNLSHLNLLIAMFRWLLPANIIVVARETNLISMNNLDYRFPKIWGVLYRLFYNRVDHVICQTETMRTDLVKHFGMPYGKTSVISNPTDVQKIRELSKLTSSKIWKRQKIHFVAVGSLHVRKNFSGLLTAIHFCENKNFSLDIIGDGPERFDLQAQIKKQKLSNRVRLLGFLVNPYPEIAAADALVLTSKYEGLPNVVLEALALQTPVIATPAGGVCCEILADQHSCIVSQNSTESSIAQAIDEWILKGGGKVSADAARQYDAATIAKKYEKLFEAVST